MSAAWPLLCACAALAAPIDDWRQRALAVRKLADNDAPAALVQAQRLQFELPRDAPTADRVRALNLLARIEIHVAHTSEAQSHAEQALREATADGDRAGQAEADMNIGLAAVNRNDVGRLVEVTSQTVAALEGIDRPDLLAEALFRGALVYRRVGRLEEAVTMALQSLDSAQRAGDPLVLAYAHHGLAISYLQSGRVSEALLQIDEMLRQAKLAGSKLQEGYALLTLFEATYQHGDRAGAQRVLDKAIQVFTPVGSPTALGIALNMRAQTALQEGRFREALVSNEQGRQILKVTQLPAGFFYSALQRSEIEQGLGHRVEALAEAEDAYRRSIALGQPLHQSLAKRRLAELAAAAGDHQRAYLLATEASELQTKANTERSAERLIAAAQRRRDEARRRELSELQRRGEQQAAELRAREQKQRWLWTVLAGSFIALAGSVAFLLRLRRSRTEVRGLAETLELRVLERTEQLERAQQAAEAAAQAKSEFLANMSHELRTPLNGILGFAQILQRDKPLSERQARGLSVIEQSGQHLLALISDILDVARADAAKLELEPSDVDLPALLTVVSDIILVKAEEKHLLFRLRVDPRLPAVVRADEKRLRQVLLNLLSNAVKFTDRGQVTLGVQALDRSQTSARLRFEVEDSGIGMDEAQRSRLFSPFEQVSDARHREGGTGLGLVISRELVRLMGGDITVRSQRGRGSCFAFEVELPLVAAAATARVARGPVIGYLGRCRRILVVDDVEQNRAVLVDGLSLVGFEMHEAEDGAEAVERSRTWRPDLVVMDITMPVMDGLEATRRIHALPDLAGLPVIMASGNASPQVQAESLAAGAKAFIAKPVDQDALLELMGDLLDLQWLHQDQDDSPEPVTGWDPVDTPPPTSSELEELQHLVRTGNMRRISEHALELESRDPQFAGLARHLRSLADGCQSKELMRLIDRLRANVESSTA